MARKECNDCEWMQCMLNSENTNACFCMNTKSEAYGEKIEKGGSCELKDEPDA